MKSTCNCRKGCSHPDLGMFVLRAVTASIFIYHGISRFQNIPGTKQFFESLGLFPELGIIVGAIEVIGGFSLLLGIWTCVFSVLLSAIVIGVITKVKFQMGWAGMEPEVLLLSALIVIKTVGPGKFKVPGGCGCFICRGNKNKACENCDCGSNTTCVCDCHPTPESKS